MQLVLELIGTRSFTWLQLQRLFFSHFTMMEKSLRILTGWWIEPGPWSYTLRDHRAIPTTPQRQLISDIFCFPNNIHGIRWCDIIW